MQTPMSLILALLIAFWLGSIPFSVWIGQFILHTDIRRYGDGNPGGTNVARAGGKLWGGVAVTLDALKGAVPMSVAYWGMGIDGVWLVPLGLAPPLGHAFSPFLGWRGGKAVATTAGVWTGLILWEAPVVIALLLVTFYYLVGVDGWAALLTILGLLPYLLLRNALFPADHAYFVPTSASMMWLWLGHVLLIAWTHRTDLRRRPGLRLRG